MIGCSYFTVGVDCDLDWIRICIYIQAFDPAAPDPLGAAVDADYPAAVDPGGASAAAVVLGGVVV